MVYCCIGEHPTALFLWNSTLHTKQQFLVFLWVNGTESASPQKIIHSMLDSTVSFLISHFPLQCDLKLCSNLQWEKKQIHISLILIFTKWCSIFLQRFLLSSCSTYVFNQSSYIHPAAVAMCTGKICTKSFTFKCRFVLWSFIFHSISIDSLSKF